WGGAHVKRTVRRRREAQRRGENLITRAEPGREGSSVEGGCSIRERDRMSGSEVVAELLLESLDERPLGDQFGSEGLDHGFHVVDVDLLPAVGQERVRQASALTSAAMDLSSSALSHQSLTSLA